MDTTITRSHHGCKCEKEEIYGRTRVLMPID